MMFGTLTVLGVVFLGVWLSLTRLHAAWWARRWVRVGTWSLLLAALAGTALRTVARTAWAAPEGAPGGHHAGLAIVGVAVASPAIVALLSLLLSLPVAAAIRGVGGRIARAASGPEPAPAPAPGPPAEQGPRGGAPEEGSAALATSEPIASERATPAPVASAPVASAPVALIRRRPLVEAAAAAVPLSFLGAGAVGVGGALAATRVVPRPMRFEGLAPALEGLRILQLTDLHIGAFMDPGGVEALVEAARPHAPDLVVLTGDICDHLPWLPASLSAIATLSPRLGILAALGNHEHYRGRAPTVRAYGRSAIDLLLDEARSIRLGDAELVVAGVDDPARGSRAGHYARAIERALDGSASAAFRLGLCHRPSGFPDLARAGVDLTLSGHTHAGQIGLGGRSAFEAVAPEAFLGGRYERGAAQLYTSTGGGHWFAFRLNCPSEAALVTLERA